MRSTHRSHAAPLAPPPNCKIAGRGTAHLEPKAPSLSEGQCHYAILEGKRRETHRIVLEKIAEGSTEEIRANAKVREIYLGRHGIAQ